MTTALTTIIAVFAFAAGGLLVMWLEPRARREIAQARSDALQQAIGELRAASSLGDAERRTVALSEQPDDDRAATAQPAGG